MINAHTWDEISGEWSDMELDIPGDSSPRDINAAVAEEVGEEPDDWKVVKTVKLHALTIIHVRSTDRDHHGYIIVNDDMSE